MIFKKTVLAGAFGHHGQAFVRRIKDIVGVNIVDIVPDADELISSYNRLRANLIFIHAFMGRMTGFEAARFIKEQASDVKLVIVSEKFSFEFLNACLELKFNGYLPLDTDDSVISDCLQEMQRKGSGFGPLISDKLQKEYANYFVAEA